MPGAAFPTDVTTSAGRHACRPVLRASCLFIAAATCLAARAEAAVYEIADDGSVRIGKSGVFEPTSSNVAQPSFAAEPEPAPDVPSAAITTVVPPEVPAGFQQPLLSASRRYGLSPRLVAALARQESAWHPAAVSSKGAVGLTQLMPATARALAVDPRDPSANLDGGARYLRMLLDQFGGNIERALAAYNAGPGRVARAAGVPAIRETRAYVATIVDRLDNETAAQGAR
jgi:soluble lytic murein transglycosylase-like protein